MFKKEILAAFRDELGWKIKSFNGKRACIKSFPDRSLRVFFSLINLDDKQAIDTHPSVSTDEFSTLCAKISGDKDSYEPLFTFFGIEADFYAPKFSLEDLQKIDKKLSYWAITQDLEKAFDRLRNLPTNARGEMPHRHLAALALAGDIAKLKSYQASFEAGDRLGFTPYVTKDHIDRALALAEQQASNS